MVFAIYSVGSAISDSSMPLENLKQISRERYESVGDSILESLYTHCDRCIKSM